MILNNSYTGFTPHNSTPPHPVILYLFERNVAKSLRDLPLLLVLPLPLPPQLLLVQEGNFL